MKKQYICLFFACLTFLLTGCDKYLDIQPTGSVIPHTLAEYRALWLNACTTVPADRGLAGMGADEMFVSNKNDQDKYGAIERWEGTTTSTTTVSFDWANYYEVLFFANFIIEHHDEINEGSQNEIAQLTGEAYLMRAYMHFILVNLHGRIWSASPSVLTDHDTGYTGEAYGKRMGPAWANSLFEDFCEFGLGMELANKKLRNRLEEAMKAAIAAEG